MRTGILAVPAVLVAVMLSPVLDPAATTQGHAHPLGPRDNATSQAPRKSGPAATVMRWIDAARAHQPGYVDEALLQVAAESPGDLAVVAEKLRSVLRGGIADIHERNDILRRGAMLHTDVAILLPEQAAAFVRGPQYGYGPLFTREADTIFVSLDGEFRGVTVDTAHWWMARLALRLVSPHPSADPFVARWYRAASAYMQLRYNLGSARFHLDTASRCG